MKFYNRSKLIPRNNWDYGIRALFGSIAGMRKNALQTLNIKDIFEQDPIWTNSGRTSLYVILKSMELPPGAKVGVPLFCCPVVFNAICQAGLSPCFLDSNINDCNVSIEDLFKKRANLAAIVVVHMFGNPCDIDAVITVADSIPVIEDCAHSLFSTYKGKLTGLLSTASFFSFRCGKYISAGEGSVIFCREPELHKKIEQVVDTFDSWSNIKMFNHLLLTMGKATLYNRPLYGLIGYPVGMRLDKKLNLTAKDGFETGKIAPTYLSLIDSRIARFQEKVNIQKEHARMLLNSVIPGDFSILSEGIDCSNNGYQFALRFQYPNQRDAMADYLFDCGIDTSKYLNNIAEEAHSHFGYQYGDCPNTELLSKTVLLVPIHYNLNTGDIEHISRSVNAGSQTILKIKEDIKNED
jgi:perosamine synthetase